MANSATQLPAFDDDTIQWKKFTSKNGATYEVGTIKTENAVKSEVAHTDSKKSSLDVVELDVTWHLARDDKWKEATQEVKNVVAISRYSLGYTAGGIYQYALWFTNTRHFDYFFYDESGDHYQVDTYLNRDHVVKYKSTAPNIIRVKAYR